MFHGHGGQVSGVRGTTRTELLNIDTNVPSAAMSNVDSIISIKVDTVKNQTYYGPFSSNEFSS